MRNHKLNKHTQTPSSLPWKPNKQRKQHNVKTPFFICSSHVLLSSPCDVAPKLPTVHTMLKQKPNDDDNAMRILEVVILAWEMEEKTKKTRDSRIRTQNERKNAHFIINTEIESIGIVTLDMRCVKRFL